MDDAQKKKKVVFLRLSSPVQKHTRTDILETQPWTGSLRNQRGHGLCPAPNERLPSYVSPWDFEDTQMSTTEVVLHLTATPMSFLYAAFLTQISGGATGGAARNERIVQALRFLTVEY